MSGSSVSSGTVDEITSKKGHEPEKAVTYFSIALNTLPEILKNAPAKC